MSRLGSATYSTQPTRILPSLRAPAPAASTARAGRGAAPTPRGNGSSTNSVAPARTGPAPAASTTSAVRPGGDDRGRPGQESAPRGRAAPAPAPCRRARASVSRKPSIGDADAQRPRDARAGSSAPRVGRQAPLARPRQHARRRDHGAGRPRQAVGASCASPAADSWTPGNPAPPPRPRAARATWPAPRTSRSRRCPARQPPHPRIGQTAVHDDRAAPAAARNAQHDQRARPDDDVREQREGVARRPLAGRVARKAPGAAADGPCATAGPPGRSTGHDDHAARQRRRIEARGQPRGRQRRRRLDAAQRADDADARPRLQADHHPRRNRSAPPVSGPGSRRPTSPPAPSPRARRRRQRDGDRARLARRDRHAADPDTARGRLDQHADRLATRRGRRGSAPASRSRRAAPAARCARRR